MQDLGFWKEIIEKVGFPIVVAAYSLLRIDKRLDRLIELYQEMIDECQRDRKD